MAHFAKIESGLVTSIIVAEQAFIDTLEGTWVQTSYNTRGNVHYGSDGLPDGGIALRANYAGIGYTYDSVNDVFYPPKPTDLHELDPSTYTWNIKSEYLPLIPVVLISTLTTLPVGQVDQNITVDTVEIRDKHSVLFSALTTNSGVYTYNKSLGVFERAANDTISTVVELNDYNTVYKFVDPAWAAEAVPS